MFRKYINLIQYGVSITILLYSVAIVHYIFSGYWSWTHEILLFNWPIMVSTGESAPCPWKIWNITEDEIPRVVLVHEGIFSL